MLWILQNFQNQKLSNNYVKGTTYGIRPLWRVLFLSLILSSFQMIILPFSDADKRGRDSNHPVFSCKEILDSGHSKGDGEYWIDPEKSGNPLKVYCDMSRYGGKRMDFFLRHEDFNRSMFDLVQLLLERSGLGYSYYVFNQNYDKIYERDWLPQAGRFEH